MLWLLVTYEWLYERGYKIIEHIFARDLQIFYLIL